MIGALSGVICTLTNKSGGDEGEFGAIVELC